jgi:hypothetical protein
MSRRSKGELMMSLIRLTGIVVTYVVDALEKHLRQLASTGIHSLLA